MSDAYRIRSDQTWADARDAYLSGHTAEDVCARYDLGLSAFRARARRQGWRRTDTPDPDPIDIDAPTPLDDLSPGELAEICMRRAARAIDRDSSAEAMRWLRLYLALKAQPHAQPHAQAVATPHAAPVARASNVHDVHAKKAAPVPSAPPPTPAPLNRADRRRQAAVERRLSG